MDKAEFAQAKAFIFTDIRREIQLAYVSEQESGKALLMQMDIDLGGGNFLAALGLLCYTEFGGKLKYDCKKPNGGDHASENFNRFFDEMGDTYRAFRAGGNNVYDIFRCGLAHEYYVKRNCTIYMMGNLNTAAVGKRPDGTYYFVVEQYYQDLKRAFDELECHLFPDTQSI